MKKSLQTIKLIQQINGNYKIQVYDGSLLIKEEDNLDLKTASARIDEIKEEGRKDAASQGMVDVGSEKASG